MLFTDVKLDWNFLLQLWYLLGVGEWKLLALCRACRALGSSGHCGQVALVRASLREVCRVRGFCRSGGSGRRGLSPPESSLLPQSNSSSELLSSLVTRTHTASTSCPTTSSPGLILTEVHSEDRGEVTPPSTSLVSGSGTLLGFLGEVGSSAERRRGSREMVDMNSPAGHLLLLQRLGQAASRGWNMSLFLHSLPVTELCCPVTLQSFPLE